MKRLQEKDADDSQCGTTIEYITQLSQLPVQSVLIQAYRDSNTNRAAIKIAKVALDLTDVIRWGDDFPWWVKEISQSDYGQLPLM